MSEAHPPDILFTERLVLRSFGIDDAPEVARMANHPRLADTLFQLPRPYRIEDAEEWIGRHDAERVGKRRHNFAICLHACGRLVGAVSLHPASPASIRATLGYWVGFEHWSRGYASEAARAVVAFGFEGPGLHRIEATCLVRNPASARVMRHAGLTREAVMRSYGRDPHTGQIEDVERWAVTRSEFLDGHQGS